MASSICETEPVFRGDNLNFVDEGKTRTVLYLRWSRRGKKEKGIGDEFIQRAKWQNWP